MIAKGEVPKWDVETKKYVSNLSEETTLMSPSTSKSEPIVDVDPQDDADVDDDLPF
jgi:hypothetical protein